MGIILLILKIIGCILLLILFLVLLVLFAPVTYRGRGKWMEETKSAGGTVSWALFILRVKVSYVKDELYYMVRIFGVPIYSSDKERWTILGREKKSKKKKSKKTKKAKTKKSKTKKSKKVSKKKQKALAMKDSKEEKKNDTSKEDVLDLQLSDEELEKAVTPLADYKKQQKEDHLNQEKSEEKVSKWKKITSAIQNIYKKIKSIWDKLMQVKNKVITVKELFEDDKIQEAIRRVWNYGKYILKITLPSKIRGWIHFGFSDPATTGQILALLGAFIPVYGERIQVEPEFEEEIFEAEGKLVGRLFLIQYVILAVKIYLDKDLFEQKDRVMDTIGG